MKKAPANAGVFSYWSPTPVDPRFIRTMLGGWAYGATYRTSSERNAALDGWLHFYNHRRPHGALSHKPPIARLHERNNLLGSYS